MLRERAEHLISRLPVGDTYAARVTQILRDGIHAGNGEISEVARKLRMSARTLQRRLRDEGVSFSQLLETTRTEMAIRHVSDSGLSLGEISYLLGYTDPVAFHHAFRRWTGIASGKYRKQCRQRERA